MPYQNLIPVDLKSLFGNDRPVTSLQAFLMKRSIIIDREINSDILSEITTLLAYFVKESKEPIHLWFLNCPGGSVDAGLAIYDLVKMLPVKIITHASGVCASMAAFLFTTLGDERVATENTSFMFHQPLSNGVFGQAVDIEIISKRINELRCRLNQMVAEHSSLSYEEIEVKFDRDCWLSTKACIEFGLCDRIMDFNDLSYYVSKESWDH